MWWLFSFRSQAMRRLRHLVGPGGIEMLNSSPAFKRIFALAEGRVTPAQAADEMAAFLRADLSSIEIRREHEGKKWEGHSHPAGPCSACGGEGKVRCSNCGGSGGRSVASAVELCALLAQDRALREWFKDQLRRAGAPSFLVQAADDPLYGYVCSAFDHALRFPLDLPCLACHGTGYKPCPRSEEIVFNVPRGVRPGWIIAGRNVTKGKPIFAVAQKG